MATSDVHGVVGTEGFLDFVSASGTKCQRLSDDVCR
jgi:hypothetical protein